MIVNNNLGSPNRPGIARKRSPSRGHGVFERRNVPLRNFSWHRVCFVAPVSGRVPHPVPPGLVLSPHKSCLQVTDNRINSISYAHVPLGSPSNRESVVAAHSAGGRPISFLDTPSPSWPKDVALPLRANVVGISRTFRLPPRYGTTTFHAC